MTEPTFETFAGVSEADRKLIMHDTALRFLE